MRDTVHPAKKPENYLKDEKGSKVEKYSHFNKVIKTLVACSFMGNSHLQCTSGRRFKSQATASCWLIIKFLKMTNFKVNKKINAEETEYVPKEAVVLCRCLLAVGLKMLSPFFRLELEKCLTNVTSTLSISFATCNKVSV